MMMMRVWARVGKDYGSGVPAVLVAGLSTMQPPLCSSKKCSPSWLALAERFDGGVVFGSPAATASAATADDGLSLGTSVKVTLQHNFSSAAWAAACAFSACFFLCLFASACLLCRLSFGYHHHRVSDLHRVPCRLLLSRVRLELW